MRKTKKILLSVMSLLLMVVLMIASLSTNLWSVSAGYRNPDTDSEVISLRNKLSSIDSKLTSLERSMKSTSSEISSETANKEYLDSKLALVSESIDVANQYISELNNSIALTQQNIEDLELSIRTEYGYFSDWIKAFYVSGKISYLEMIFDNKDFMNVMTTTEYVADIMKSNNKYMEQLEQDFADLKEQKAKLEGYKAEQEEAAAKLLLQKQEYETLSAQSAQYINSLKKDYATQQAEYKKTIQAEQELNKQLEEELALIAYQNAVYVGGELRWPVDYSYSRISSPYGYRTLFGYTSLHTGIDIPCNLNANVYAANAGTVIKACAHSTYGNYVLIDHGGGKATLYAHNNKLCVTEGQRVNKGDVIALAGTTGQSTGVHCHFEVRVNGVTVNPLDYVKQP